MNEDIVFGPAILEAYELENKNAIYPRIIISKNIASILRNLFDLLESTSEKYFMQDAHTVYKKDVLALVEAIFYKDSDEQLYINYLGFPILLLEAYLFDANKKEQIKNEYKEYILIHKDMVNLRISEYANDPRILSKYIWVANYHNRFCKERFADKDDLLIENVPNIRDLKEK